MIAILAILAAILFPVFARAREKARQSSCASNLKQLALANLMYAQDYDEHFVLYYRYVEMPQGRRLIWWGDILQPYIKNYQLLVCPSYHWPPYTYLRPENLPNPLVCSYALPNIQHNAAHNVIARLPGNAMAQVPEPANTIMIAESVGSEIYTGGTPNYTLLQIMDGGSIQRVRLNHNDGANYAFADGHVKWFRQTQPGMWTITAGD